jgi:hypothetical protein
MNVAAPVQQPAAPEVSEPSIEGLLEPGKSEPPKYVGVEATNKLPPEQLTAAFQTGQLGFHEDEKVPVRFPNGKIGTAPAKIAQQIVADGGEIIPHAVAEHARLSKEYGGAGGTFAAGIAGAARGASIGASDPIAILAAQTFGGDQAAAKMRERLSAYKEVSPIASAVGEVTGIVAPALLGDEAGLLGVVGAPMKGIGTLGEGVASLVPKMGESLLARAGTSALKHGVSDALQTAIMAGGQEISESALGDTQLTGEKLLAAMGHGAVVGGLLGGALGGAGEVAGDALSALRAKASPILSKQAGSQMAKAVGVDAGGRLEKEIERRFDGGVEELGKTLNELDITGAREGGLVAGALKPEEILPRVQAKLDEVGPAIGKAIDESGATVKIDTLNSQIEEVIAPLRKKAGFGKVVKAVEDYRDDLFEKLGAVADEGAVAAGKTAPELIIPPHLEHAREQIEELARRAAKGEAGAQEALDAFGVKRGEVAAEKVAGILDKEVPASALFEQKRALGDLVYKEAKALDPSMRVEQLRAIYGRMGDLELDAVEQAAKQLSKSGFDAARAAGGGAAIGAPGELGEAATAAWKARTGGQPPTVTRAELLNLRKQYQALSLAKKGLEGKALLPAPGIFETMTGAGAGVGALLSGHPIGFAVGMASGAAQRWAKARTHAFLAGTFDKLAALQTLASKSGQIDRDIAAGTKAFVQRAKGQPGPKMGPLGSREKPTGETAREEFERRVQEVEGATKADHGATVSALQPHAPSTALAFKGAAERATLWLAAQVPKPSKIGSGTASDQEVTRFNMQARAVSNPVGTIVRGMANGQLSPIETGAIRDCHAYDALLADIQTKMAVEAKKTLARTGKQLPYPVRRDLALLFDVPDWSMSAEGVKTLQGNTQPPPGGAGGGKPGPQGGPAPKRPVESHAEQFQSEAQRIQGGRQQGQIR